jgi:capsular polysaccharide export protein
VQFQRPADPLPPAATLVLWGHQPLPAAAGSAPPQGVVRLEDGFLRSVGLGADLRQPMSWVQDEQGLYYDATAPSGLERLLQTEAFAPGMLQRAALLRERIVAEGVTKYNLTSGSWHRPAGRARVVLVVGQVEDDASIRYGAPGICTNLGLLQAVRQACPDDWLVYKPHPDVVARLRQAGQGEQDARQHCDELVTEAPIQSLLQAVDQVHVLTSLTGFEALLRGTAVVVWGCPFYAGWGLTDDRQPNVRRRRPLTLDMLVAGALILYPTYVSRTTGRFTTPERVLDELLSARQRATAAETGVLPSLWQAGRRAALRWAVRWRKPGV